MTKPANTTDTGGGQLRAFIERIERLDEELKAINGDKREVFAEAKANGFDTKAMKIVLRERRQDASERMELESLVDLYRAALGMTAAPREDDDEPRAPAPARAREIIEEFPSADPTHVAADQSTGNVDGSAGRSHSAVGLSTESPASVPVDTNSNLQDDLGDQAGAAAAGLPNTRDMRRDSLKPVGLSIGAADIPMMGAVR